MACATDGGESGATESDCSEAASDCPVGYECVLLTIGGWACVDPTQFEFGSDETSESGVDTPQTGDETSETGDDTTARGDDTADETGDDTADETGEVIPLTVTLELEGEVLSGLSHAAAEVTSGVPLVGVEFQVDGLTVSTDIVPPYGVTLDTAAFEDGPHTISAWVADQAGATANTERSATFDNTPPDMIELSPGDGQTVFAEDGDLVVRTVVADPSNVASLTFRANGLLVGEFTSPPFEATVAHDQLYLGPEQLPKAVELEFRAEDALGQVTEVTHHIEIHQRLVWELVTLGEIWGHAVALPNGNMVFGNLNNKLFSVTPDGAEAWSVQVGADIVTGPTVHPVTSNLYFGSLDGFVHAVSSGGASLWTYDVGSPIGGQLAVLGSALYAAGFDGTVTQLDTNSGAFGWSVTLPGEIQSSPAVAEDGTVFVGCNDDSMYAIRDGEVLWGMPTGGPVQSSPALGMGGVVYVGSNDGWVYAVKTGGQLVWQVEIEGLIRSRPLVGPDLSIYVASNSHRVHKLDALDGNEIWDVKLQGMTYSSPVQGEDGTIYVGTTPGLLYALDPEDGATRFSYGVGDTIHATPLLLGGRVYVGSTNRSFFGLWQHGVTLSAAE